MNNIEQTQTSLQAITNLYAVEEFKQTVNALEIFRKNKEQSGVKEVTLPNYLWVFQRGGGVSTCVNAFAEYLYDAKLMEFKGNIKYFEFIPDNIPDAMTSPEITELNDIISDNAGNYLHYKGIACIIIDNWIGKTQDPHFQKILDYLENKNDKILSIFCVHSKDDKQIAEIESSISSYLRFETIRFRFPNAQELIEFIEKKYLHNNQFTLAKDAKKLLTETIDDILTSKNFNGFVTIKQLGNDILFKVLASPAYKKNEQQKAGFQITADMLSDFHKNSAYIKSLKKIGKSKKTIGFNVTEGRS